MGRVSASPVGTSERGSAGEEDLGNVGRQDWEPFPEPSGNPTKLPRAGMLTGIGELRSESVQ